MGKIDKRTGERTLIRFRVSTPKALHAQYVINVQDISLSQFSALFPKNIIIPKPEDWGTLCRTCTNPRLKYLSLARPWYNSKPSKLQRKPSKHAIQSLYNSIGRKILLCAKVWRSSQPIMPRISYQCTQWCVGKRTVKNLRLLFLLARRSHRAADVWASLTLTLILDKWVDQDVEQVILVSDSPTSQYRNRWSMCLFAEYCRKKTSRGVGSKP